MNYLVQFVGCDGSAGIVVATGKNGCAGGEECSLGVVRCAVGAKGAIHVASRTDVDVQGNGIGGFACTKAIKLVRMVDRFEGAVFGFHEAVTGWGSFQVGVQALLKLLGWW